MHNHGFKEILTEKGWTGVQWKWGWLFSAIWRVSEKEAVCWSWKNRQSEKKELYKAKLSYKKNWETKYPWVYCNNASEGMFCSICKRWGKPPAGSRGAWTTRGITDWNHATELLKQHADSQWHRNAAAMAAMAEQAEKGKSVLELQCTSAAREEAERKEKNRQVLLKLLRSVYFLVKNWIPHSTTYRELVELQVANGDQLLEQHINSHPLNAQYTSRFSATMLIEAIDTWLERKLLQSLKSSPCFAILADECQDISSQEELSICFQWLVNGCPEEHYLTTLHVKSTNARAITAAITSYMNENHLECAKLVGQGYDGAATFSGSKSGVQKRMRVHAGHALYIHCSCHRLQLASIQAAESVAPIKKMFGTMESLWKLFYYSPKKAEALKDVQCVLNMPELKIVKPSDTRCLSHERCLRAIRKELASLIINLDNLYEESGDAEAYGLSLVLSSFSGIASVFLLSAALDLLAKLNCFMQKKAADFSRLPIILEGIISELKPFPTFRQLLSQPKDKVPELQRSGVIYKIPCTNCSVVYIGQTGTGMISIPYSNTVIPSGWDRESAAYKPHPIIVHLSPFPSLFSDFVFEFSSSRPWQEMAQGECPARVRQEMLHLSVSVWLL